MRFLKSVQALCPSHQQQRLFWTSFFISILFLVFLAGFLYVSYGHQTAINEPVISAGISSSHRIHSADSSDRKKHPLDEADVFFVSFFGIKKEFSVEQLQTAGEQISRLYSRYGILIPARYRAAGGAVYLLWKIIG